MKPSFIMIHHTAVSYEKNPDQFIANNAYHKAQWKFKSSMGFYLGYNYEIVKNGKVYQARKSGETTAACYQSDMNDGRCIHIALDGNFDTEKPFPNQIFALRDLMKELVAEFDIKKNNIILHRGYANKSCPGNNVEIGFIQSLVFPDAVENPDTPDLKEKLIKLVQELLSLIRKI